MMPIDIHQLSQDGQPERNDLFRVLRLDQAGFRI
jgi:hypothetical protein